MSSSPPVSPATEDELPFTRRDMVQWFAPEMLARAGIKALLSKLFGAYADNRELQAIRQGIVEFSHEFDEHGELWLDYVADLGDGWDSTYSIARLIAEAELSVSEKNGAHLTKRGKVLVMGGDQVYPTASPAEYRDRLEGPYRCALPSVHPESDAPTLYAIPGNHDWYDGLTSFTRLFCQSRWIGGWKTRQTRSYFALQLPMGWWLWGLDVQLDSDIDQPQLHFFRTLARRLKTENPDGVKIIIALAQPMWVSAEREGPETYENLAVFERLTIQEFGHRHVVGLSGDLHAYARYESEDRRQRFVSGGGGAYLFPTHTLPETLNLPTAPLIGRTKRDLEQFKMGSNGEGNDACYPPRRESVTISLKSLLFAWYSKGFALLLGAFYLFIVWLIESASVTGRNVPISFFDVLADRSAGVVDVFSALQRIVVHAPLAAVAVCTLLAGLVAFADAKGTKKLMLGAAHTILHVVGVVFVSWFFVRYNAKLAARMPDVFGNNPSNGWQILLFSAEMLLAGSIVAGFLWGLYLFFSHGIGRDTHTNDVMACQRNPDFKHFLRLRIDRAGSLTIFPIGIRQVPREWQYRANATDGKSWFEPAGKKAIGEFAELIESPIVIKP